MERLDAFTCCAYYSDFLRITLAKNRKQFDRMVVVTIAEDKETYKICEDHDVEWVNFNLSPIPKNFMFGSGLNYAYSVLNPSDWVCKLDADVLLPDSFRDDVSKKLEDRTAIYGTRRKVYDNKKAYLNWVKEGMEFYTSKREVRLNKVAQGYLQLFHSSSASQPLYGETGNASKADTWFRDQFQTVNYLGFDVVHIGPTVTNWCGRESESWD